MDELVFSSSQSDLTADQGPGDASAEEVPRAVAMEREVDRLTAIARAKAAAVTVAVAELVDAVAALEPHEGRIAATWRQWVSWQCGLTTAETRRICTLATTLPDLPLIDAAFRSGQISDGVADLLARVATPDNEAALLATVEGATGAQLQVLVRDFRRMKRDTNPKAHDDEHPETAPSEVWWGWGDNGRFGGGFDLRPDLGSHLEAALEGALADLRPDPCDHPDSEHPNPVTDGDLRPEERSRVRRVDALGALADTYLAHTATDGMVPETHQVILHRDLAADGTDPGPVDSLFPTTLPGCGVIDRRLAEMMHCDALVITQDHINGFPVSVPTAVRTFNRTQRRALRARDRTCRFPGCPRTKHLHAHHTRHWDDTHQTTVADGMLLCHQHHTLIHLRRSTIHLDPGTGAAVVTRADGSELRGATPKREPCRQAPPPSGTRTTGAGEPLTHYARDVITATWHHATARAGPAPPDDG